MPDKKDSITEALPGPLPSETESDMAPKDMRHTDTVAVAVEYDPESEFAPKIIAGGRGRIAEQILRIAFDHDIKVREDADLAEMLNAVDINSEIPLKAFAAVAEILTYIYQVNGNAPDLIREDAREEPVHQKNQQHTDNSKHGEKS